MEAILVPFPVGAKLRLKVCVPIPAMLAVERLVLNSAAFAPLIVVPETVKV